MDVEIFREVGTVAMKVINNSSENGFWPHLKDAGFAKHITTKFCKTTIIMKIKIVKLEKKTNHASITTSSTGFTIRIKIKSVCHVRTYSWFWNNYSRPGKWYCTLFELNKAKGVATIEDTKKFTPDKTRRKQRNECSVLQYIQSPEHGES